MGYLLSEDSQALVSDVRAFCEAQMKKQVYDAEKLSYTEEGQKEANKIIDEILKGLYEMGMFTLALPEEKGGAGLTKIERAALVEEISKYDAGIGITLMANELALDSVEIAGSQEQKDHCYEILANGGYGCFCLTEPNAGCDVSGATTTAVADGDDFVINGTKCFITNGPIADFFVVYAITDKSVPAHKGYTAFLVDKGTPGLSIGTVENKMGIRHSHTSEVIFQDMRVSKDQILGQMGKGFPTAMKTLDIARIWCAIVGLGVAQRAIDESVSYAKERVQFGKPIAKNEVIQFKIADMAMRAEAARQMCIYAINTQEAGLPISLAAAEAKCLAGDAAMANALEAVQIHGGYGYSREYPVEKLVRDAKIYQIFEGTNEIQRLVIATNTIGR